MGNRACAQILTGMIALAMVSPFTASAAVRITEIMYDADGNDAKREWVEIYNDGSEAVNIADWKFIDKANHALNVPPKNGGVGSTVIPGGRYAILASDAATFIQEYPGLSIVIDTALSLNNSGGTFGIKSTVMEDTVTYTKSQGAADDGESLQLHDGAWIHAKPTPGAANATASSIKAVQAKPAPAAKKTAAAKPKTSTPKQPASVDSERYIDISNDPLAIVNAVPDEVQAQTAAAGGLGGSIWWAAAAALAIGTGATASYISRSKKNEWDIEESG